MVKKLLLLVLICLTLPKILYGYDMYDYLKETSDPLLKELLAINESDNETIRKVINLFYDKQIYILIEDSVDDIKEPVYAHGWTADKRNDQAYLIGFWLTNNSWQGLSEVQDSCLLYENPTNKNNYLIVWLYEVNIVTETVHSLKDNQELQHIWNLPEDLMPKYYSSKTKNPFGTFEVDLIRLTPEEEEEIFGETDEYRERHGLKLFTKEEKETYVKEREKKRHEKTMWSDNGLFFNIIMAISLIFYFIPWWGWIIIILIILGLLCQ